MFYFHSSSLRAGDHHLGSRIQTELLQLLTLHLPHLLPEVVAESEGDGAEEPINGFELAALALECPRRVTFIQLYDHYLNTELSTLSDNELLHLFADEQVTWLLVDHILLEQKPLLSEDGRLADDLADVVTETLAAAKRVQQ